MKEKKYIVYQYTSPSGKYYIGQTCRSLRARSGYDGRRYKRCAHFYSAILKYGFENFEVKVVMSNLSKKEADWLERYLISYYHSNESQFGYNITAGGKGTSGYVVSEETKQRLREFNTGKTLSEEHKRKISESNKGQKVSEKQREILRKCRLGKHLSEETKKKVSESLKGRLLSEEHKRKISESHKGKRLTEEQKLKLKGTHLNQKSVSKAVVCVETNIVYVSGQEAQRQTGICAAHINDCRLGKRKTAGGYHWKAYDESI